MVPSSIKQGWTSSDLKQLTYRWESCTCGAISSLLHQLHLWARRLHYSQMISQSKQLALIYYLWQVGSLNSMTLTRQRRSRIETHHIKMSLNVFTKRHLNSFTWGDGGQQSYWSCLCKLHKLITVSSEKVRIPVRSLHLPSIEKCPDWIWLHLLCQTALWLFAVALNSPNSHSLSVGNWNPPACRHECVTTESFLELGESPVFAAASVLVKYHHYCTIAQTQTSNPGTMSILDNSTPDLRPVPTLSASAGISERFMQRGGMWGSGNASKYIISLLSNLLTVV